MITQKNNLGFIRFFAACMVIFSHSYALSGTGIVDPLKKHTDHMSIGGLALAIFFVISGYLITASYLRSLSNFRYITSRILRIFPALFLCLLITIFFIGPLITNHSVKEYLTDTNTYKYFYNLFLYPVVYELPGIKFSNSFYGEVVNGSLWSLSYEFTLYLIILILGSLNKLNKNIGLFIFILLVVFYSLYLFNIISLDYLIPYIRIQINTFIFFSIYFFSGSLYFFWDNEIDYTNIRFFLFLLISIVSLINGSLFVISSFFTLPYIVFHIAKNKKARLHNFNAYGDFSYGIYIYGFLIQQLLFWFNKGNMHHHINFILSLPFAVIMGFFSWHLIEKRALKLKPKVMKNHKSLVNSYLAFTLIFLGK